MKRGWIYREESIGVTPARIKVDLDSRPRKTFDDNTVGASEAAAYITSQLGDDWKLEDMQFLGYRIVQK